MWQWNILVFLGSGLCVYGIKLCKMVLDWWARSNNTVKVKARSQSKQVLPFLVHEIVMKQENKMFAQRNVVHYLIDKYERATQNPPVWTMDWKICGQRWKHWFRCIRSLLASLDESHRSHLPATTSRFSNRPSGETWKYLAAILLSHVGAWHFERASGVSFCWLIPW